MYASSLLPVFPHLKLVIGGDCFRLGKFPSTYQELEDLARAKCQNSSLPDNFCFKYEDSEKDSINLESQLDFEAFKDYCLQEKPSSVKIRIDSKSFKQYYATNNNHFHHHPLHQVPATASMLSHSQRQLQNQQNLVNQFAINPFLTTYQNYQQPIDSSARPIVQLMMQATTTTSTTTTHTTYHYPNTTTTQVPTTNLPGAQPSSGIFGDVINNSSHALSQPSLSKRASEYNETNGSGVAILKQGLLKLIEGCTPISNKNHHNDHHNQSWDLCCGKGTTTTILQHLDENPQFLLQNDSSIFNLHHHHHHQQQQQFQLSPQLGYQSAANASLCNNLTSIQLDGQQQEQQQMITQTQEVNHAADINGNDDWFRLSVANSAVSSSFSQPRYRGSDLLNPLSTKETMITKQQSHNNLSDQSAVCLTAITDDDKRDNNLSSYSHSQLNGSTRFGFMSGISQAYSSSLASSSNTVALTQGIRHVQQRTGTFKTCDTCNSIVESCQFCNGCALKESNEQIAESLALGEQQLFQQVKQQSYNNQRESIQQQHDVLQSSWQQPKQVIVDCLSDEMKQVGDVYGNENSHSPKQNISLDSIDDQLVDGKRTCICVSNTPLKSSLSTSKVYNSTITSLSSSMNRWSLTQSSSNLMNQSVNQARVLLSYCSEELVNEKCAIAYVELANNGHQNWPENVVLRCISGIADNTQHEIVQVEKNGVISVLFTIPLKDLELTDGEDYWIVWRLAHVQGEERSFFGPVIKMKFTYDQKKSCYSQSYLQQDLREQLVFARSELKKIFAKDDLEAEPLIDEVVNREKIRIQEHTRRLPSAAHTQDDNNKTRSRLILRLISSFIQLRNIKRESQNKSNDLNCKQLQQQAMLLL